MGQLNTDYLLNKIRSISDENTEIIKGKDIQGIRDSLTVLFPDSNADEIELLTATFILYQTPKEQRLDDYSDYIQPKYPGITETSLYNTIFQVREEFQLAYDNKY